MRHETGDNESLRSNSVYSLLVDRNGMIWIGFYQLGLDYTLYQSDLFTTYAFPPYFNSRDMPIRALAINGHEKLVGSRDGLFYIDEKRNRFKSFQSPEMRSGMIFCILFYEGEYYVGTYGGGMYIFNPERLTIRDFAPDGEQQPFVKGHIFCIKQDAEGNLWIGTSQGVYCYKDGRQVAHYTSSNSRLFLQKEEIITREELAAYRKPLEEQVLSLMKERRELYRKEPGGMRIQAINGELKELRKKIRLSRQIEKQSLEMEERLRQAKAQEQEMSGKQRRETERNR